MGSEVDPFDDPELVKELGVEAAVLAPEDVADWTEVWELEGLLGAPSGR